MDVRYTPGGDRRVTPEGDVRVIAGTTSATATVYVSVTASAARVLTGASLGATTLAGLSPAAHTAPALPTPTYI